jgi:hypothetical protein
MLSFRIIQIEIEFEYGPLDIRLESDADEEYDQVLEDISEFIEGHEYLFDTAEPLQESETEEQPEGSGPEDTIPARFSEDEIGVEPESETELDDENWGTIVEETGVSETRLQHMFAAGDEIKPRILVGEILPDGSDNETMETGALLILTIWEDYNGEQYMDVSDIKECLRHSGVPYENFTNIYQRSSFSTNFVRKESEGSSMLSLTPPGKRQAYDFIEDISDEIEV